MSAITAFPLRNYLTFKAQFYKAYVRLSDQKRRLLPCCGVFAAAFPPQLSHHFALFFQANCYKGQAMFNEEKCGLACKYYEQAAAGRVITSNCLKSECSFSVKTFRTVWHDFLFPSFPKVAHALSFVFSFPTALQQARKASERYASSTTSGFTYRMQIPNLPEHIIFVTLGW